MLDVLDIQTDRNDRFTFKLDGFLPTDMRGVKIMMDLVKESNKQAELTQQLIDYVNCAIKYSNYPDKKVDRLKRNLAWIKKYR